VNARRMRWRRINKNLADKVTMVSRSREGHLRQGLTALTGDHSVIRYTGTIHIFFRSVAQPRA
jgi:hypothetical protein